MPGTNGRDIRRNGRAARKTPAHIEANRRPALALRLARGEDRSQEEFAAELRRIGVPASAHQISGWELGGEPGDAPIRNIAIVPAYALVGAAKVANRSVGELLTMAGVEGQEPLIDQVAYLRRRQQMMWEALNQFLSDQGLPVLPEIEEGTAD